MGIRKCIDSLRIIFKLISSKFSSIFKWYFGSQSKKKKGWGAPLSTVVPHLLKLRIMQMIWSYVLCVSDNGLKRERDTSLRKVLIIKVLLAMTDINSCYSKKERKYKERKPVQTILYSSDTD